MTTSHQAQIPPVASSYFVVRHPATGEIPGYHRPVTIGQVFWPDRERTCTRCGLRCRRYGIGRDSYYGFLLPGQDHEQFPSRVPPCEPAPDESET